MRYALALILCALTLTRCAKKNEQTNIPVIPTPDLGVSFIHRSPTLDFVWGSVNPDIDGWPATGQVMTWEASVYNPGKQLITNVDYSWVVDGITVKEGQFTIDPGKHAKLYLERSWTFNRENIKIIIDPLNKLKEPNRSNNELVIYSDALSIGFYVEQSVFKHYLSNPDFLATNVGTWYDWAQFQLNQFNELFGNSGVNERWRLDNVTVVDDGTLTNMFSPNIQDKTIDIQFGFLTRLNGIDSYKFYDETVKFRKPSGFLLHEMLHARYLLDNYSFNVLHETNNSRVNISENGLPVAGSNYMPGTPITVNGITGLQLFSESENDLMSNVANFHLSSFTIRCINYLKGQRATHGNYNSPSDFYTKFLSLLPGENILAFKDINGMPISNASVQVYQAVQANYGQQGIYAKSYDNVPDLTYVTDSEGKVVVGRNPFAGGIVVPQSVAYSGGTIIIRVEKNGKVGYTFLSANTFINQYLSGNTGTVTYPVRVDLID